MKNETTFVKIGGSGYVRLPVALIKWFEVKPNEILFLEDIETPEGKNIKLTKGTGEIKERKKKRDTQPDKEQKIGQDDDVSVVHTVAGDTTITENPT